MIENVPITQADSLLIIDDFASPQRGTMLAVRRAVREYLPGVTVAWFASLGVEDTNDAYIKRMITGCYKQRAEGEQGYTIVNEPTTHPSIMYVHNQLRMLGEMVAERV